MRRDSQRFPVVELIALIVSLTLVLAIMIVTLLPADPVDMLAEVPPAEPVEHSPLQ
ncbi:hypothetical protein [Sinorhizobium alkalisoli]|uniref:hypothetical protein n=1 Tax=Sinorhizobium alkalisoli TaxID=1752398 RepID=UPI00178C4A24|nr:hypothetical protein [Sinorhizobium alkalisoli]MCA1492278.1 hypothetical protein [Ensifer sp. NBAIM29]